MTSLSHKAQTCSTTQGEDVSQAFYIHSLEKLFHLLPTKSSAFPDLV